MTKEEAITKYIVPAIEKTWNDKRCKEILEALEQEPCDDVVSRRAAIEIARSNIHYGLDKEYEYSRELLEKTMAEISSLPPITPQPKTGHWSRKTKVDAYDIAGVKTWGIKCQCDRCDFTTIVVEDFGYYKFCPNCGAKMVEPQESEE